MIDTDEITALRAENERLREEAEFGYMTGFDVAKNQYCTMVQGLEDENERLLAANRDAMLHWEVLKADYERLRAALEKINVGEGWAAIIARAALEGKHD